MNALLKAFVIGILMTLFGFYSMLVISTCWQQQTPREGLPSLAHPPIQPPPSVQYVLVEPSKCPPRVIEVKHFVIGGIDDLLNKTLHLAFITDGGSNPDSEFKNLKVSLRSWLYFRRWPIQVHLFTTYAVYDKVQKEIINEWHINPENFQITFYNVDHCRSQLGDLKSYVLLEYPWPSLCKLLLHRLLPDTVPFVLVQDLDVWVAQSDVFETCWKKVFKEMSLSGDNEHFIGMALDPSPPAYTSQKAAWPIKGTFQYNGGILWLYLEKMRKNQFWDRMLETIRKTYFEKMNQSKARKGEQCFLNAWHVEEPSFLYEVSCGCNYQIAKDGMPYRDVVCPSPEPVNLVHNWNGNRRSNSTVYGLVPFFESMDEDDRIIKRLNSYNCPPPVVDQYGNKSECP